MSLARVNNLQTKPSPRTIWARVLYDLKEKREYELHSVCLNLDKVALNGNLFVITVYDQKTLDKLQNSKESAFEYQISDPIDTQNRALHR